MAAELGQQTVEFSALVSLVADDSFLSLKDLVDNAKSSKQSDDEKKRNILKYVFKTQQRMLRLYALAKWCRQVCLFVILFIFKLMPLEFSVLQCQFEIEDFSFGEF